ncbi:MAG: putative Fe-S cluster assembly protein SufT [Chthoniobacteraceae bacterium]|nr:putative Fe-S cluster assembly protein SufT [Chthoniobacteraceae bacterium]
MHDDEIELTRDCEAIQIPQGTTVTLPAGTHVNVTQSLGGSYTISTGTGHLYRITDANADAIGREVPAKPAAGAEAAQADEAAVWEQLKTCYDPEIPVNIVDLGLIYDCTVEHGENGKAKVSVKMTLTAPGCGMGPTIAAEARMRIESIPGVEEANVELVWDPPWDQSMISEAGKMKLGLI